MDKTAYEINARFTAIEHKKTIVKAPLFKTYGRDGAGIEYWYPAGTKAVRLQRVTAGYADAPKCDCHQDPKFAGIDNRYYLVQLATGSRSWEEGPTFITVKQHKSSDCAAAHLNRIHRG